MIDLWLVAIIKLSERAPCHIQREQIPFEHQSDVDVTKKQLSNMTVIKHNYTKTCY